MNFLHTIDKTFSSLSTFLLQVQPVTREFHSKKLICGNLYVLFSYVKNLHSQLEWRTALSRVEV